MIFDDAPTAIELANDLADENDELRRENEYLKMELQSVTSDNLSLRAALNDQQQRITE